MLLVASRNVGAYVTCMKLIKAEQCLDTVFDQEARPSIRWFWNQVKRKTIPCVRIGRLVFFDSEQVKTALEKRTVKAAK